MGRYRSSSSAARQGSCKANRHSVAKEQTPMSNLLLGILDKLGVHQESFGDSTGKLEI